MPLEYVDRLIISFIKKVVNDIRLSKETRRLLCEAQIKRNKHPLWSACFFLLVSQSQAKSNSVCGNFITDEYTHTLRLESELSDLRVGYANPATLSPGEIHRTSHQKKNHPIQVRIRWFLVTRTGIEPMFSA